MVFRVGSCRGPSGLGAGPLVRCSRQTEESGDLSPWRRGPVGLDGVGVLPRRGLDCLQCWLRTVGGMRACGHNACRGRWLSRVTHWTRLETRTKECSTRASLWPEWPPGAVRAKVCSLRTEARAPCRVAGPIADRFPCTPCRDSSESARAATRKMVNYARAGRSQGKPWWRPAAVLTCKSIV